MHVVNSFLLRARRLKPGGFAAVMATGIVSIDANQHGMPRLALALFVVNVAVYLRQLVLVGTRLVCFPRALRADFVHPARGAGFLTLAAGSSVLGSQCVLVLHLPWAAQLLLVLSALFWTGLTYLFFAAIITAQHKPRVSRSVDGSWLVIVVATQALAVLCVVLTADGHVPDTAMLLTALCLYLLGAALYLLLITLVVYRMVFLLLSTREFTPPYWINMGALAITTLAGSVWLLHAPTSGALTNLIPFVQGFTLFFWATATWWIPLLALLEVWRHWIHHLPLRYAADNWDIVFPLGMYSAGTFALAHALQLPFLLWISTGGVYVSIVVWLLTAAGAVRHGYRASRTNLTSRPLQ